jgi:hypothetical protein
MVSGRPIAIPLPFKYIPSWLKPLPFLAIFIVTCPALQSRLPSLIAEAIFGENLRRQNRHYPKISMGK